MRELEADIVQNINIARNIYLLSLKLPENFAQEVVPGQFAHIKVPGDRLLRRPISINDYNPETNVMSFVYQIKGEGTIQLARAQGRIRLLLPLGNGFPPKKGKVLLAGAGIGCAPLLYAARILGSDCGAVLAFRSGEYSYQLDQFDAHVSEMLLCTDDGSAGSRCYAHEGVAELLKTGKYQTVYACGPAPALKLIRDVCSRYGAGCYLSLEARMGCGVGACVVCNVKIGNAQEWHYKRCCKDGPVFEGKEVIFDD
ncbi:MAG: dihydroorotate dehydrogenase electron transfer subunit [Christensenellaceae bacterium]|jgi:oxidoreductase FAD/NAD(P)-binding domain protein|nr:dihydroorotate dehydrogenase electron transfer subunit [Christensenellaceae bacterium]PWL99030.1 MAG: dihydroorotate dehydrogenase electron transfer subunit [Selenomonadales bacterium]